MKNEQILETRSYTHSLIYIQYLQTVNAKPKPASNGILPMARLPALKDFYKVQRDIRLLLGQSYMAE